MVGLLLREGEDMLGLCLDEMKIDDDIRYTTLQPQDTRRDINIRPKVQLKSLLSYMQSHAKH